MKVTPLNNWHKKSGARMVEFSGWEMPISFTGIIEEHLATRESAGIFDVSHMGEIFIEGEEAEMALNYFCCNDINKITDGQAQYTALLNNHGGVIDDLIVYRININKFLLCVNAGNTETDFKWLLKQNRFNIEITDHSNFYGLIAIQGPKSQQILQQIFPEIDQLKYFHFTESYYQNSPVIIARTGYTGEDGFEIFISKEQIEDLYLKLLEEDLIQQ